MKFEYCPVSILAAVTLSLGSLALWLYLPVCGESGEQIAGAWIIPLLGESKQLRVRVQKPQSVGFYRSKSYN